MVTALNAVAQAHGANLAIVIAVPGDHGVGVGVVEQQAVGVGHFPDIPAQAFQHSDITLGVHDAAGAEGVTDTLVNTVL